MRERLPKDCSHCGVSFYPRRVQIDANKTGLFFCNAEHMYLFKQSRATTYYKNFRKYILERDGGCCVVCGLPDSRDIHHIVFRSHGGTDEYANLCTLCRRCHQEKAHGVEAREIRDRLLTYTSTFSRPDFWDQMISRSKRDREKARKKHCEYARLKYQRIKASPQYEKYRKEQKIRMVRYKERLKAGTNPIINFRKSLPTERNLLSKI